MLWVPVSNSRRSTPWCRVSNSVFRKRVISGFSFVLVTIPKVWNWADSLGQGISHTILIKLEANGIYTLGEDFSQCRWPQVKSIEWLRNKESLCLFFFYSSVWFLECSVGAYSLAEYSSKFCNNLPKSKSKIARKVSILCVPEKWALALLVIRCNKISDAITGIM